MDALITLIAILLLAVPLAVLIALFVRVVTLGRRITALEEHLGLRAAEPPKTPAVSAVPTASPPPVQPPATRPSKFRQQELEALIGGRLLNRIGALALIIGMGFFLKYAFDHGWFSETMRVLTGVIIGSVCLWGGDRSRRRGYVVFAQGLVGAGVAILYLSLYASFNFYQLIPQWTAFLLMSAVTILTLIQAVRYDSLAVGIFGWAGGFLTPFMLSTGESNELALFTYAALLALGILAITLRKESWYALEPLTLAGVGALFLAWYAQFYTNEDLILTLFFVAVFWLLFHAADIMRARSGFARYAGLRHVVQSLVGIFTAVAVAIPVGEYDSEGVGISLFCLALLYAGSAAFPGAIPADARGMRERWEGLTAFLVLLGTAFEFRGMAAVRLWGIEGLLLFLAGVRRGRPALLVAGPAFMALALAGFLADGSLAYEPIGSFSLFGTDRILTAGILAAALGISALLSASAASPVARRLRPFLGVAFFLTIFLALTAEVNDYFRYQLFVLRRDYSGVTIRQEIDSLLNLRQLAVSGLWLAYSLVTMTVGLLRGARGPRYFAIGLFGLTILKIFIVDLAFLETLYRVFSFIGLGVILLGVSYAYQRFKSVLFDSELPSEQRISS